MARRYESFAMSQVRVTDSEIQIQGKTAEGKKHEFSLVFNRDMATNHIDIGVSRHFSDPDSVPYFEDSEPWTEDETRGDG